MKDTGSVWPLMICTGMVHRVNSEDGALATRQTHTMPILCSGSDREAARGRALTLLEQAYPFADGWTGHYVTDALVPMVDMLGSGTPIVIQTVRLVEPSLEFGAADGSE